MTIELLRLRPIARDLPSFARIVLAPKLRRRLGSLSEDEVLKRTPRGFEEDHAAARWLELQSFTVVRRLNATLGLPARSGR